MPVCTRFGRAHMVMSGVRVCSCVCVFVARVACVCMLVFALAGGFIPALCVYLGVCGCPVCLGMRLIRNPCLCVCVCVCIYGLGLGLGFLQHACLN